jgi:hypothetical protein
LCKVLLANHLPFQEGPSDLRRILRNTLGNASSIAQRVVRGAARSTACSGARCGFSH